jgi:hypothetical protein
MPLVSKSFSDIITFSRGTNATYFDSAGVLKYAPNNAIRNNTGVGAVAGTPGTLPTNWSTFTPLTGLTREIVGTGIENGINYIDIRLSGTPSGAGLYLINFEANNQTSALNGQIWSGSSYFKLQSGTLAGVSSLVLRTSALDAALAEVSTSSQSFTPTSSALNTQRIIATLTNASASVLYEIVYLRLSLSGAAIDITLRIGLPQLEIGNTAGPAIPTSGTAYYGPRFDYNPSTLAAQGLLIEEQRTNSIRNNTMQGAVVGVVGSGGALPTNWSIFGSGGLTTEIIGTGSSSGISYIDIKISGTSTSTFYVLAVDSPGISTTTTGQSYAASMWMAVVAGSSANTTYVAQQARQLGGASPLAVENINTATSTLTRYTNAVVTTVTGVTSVTASIAIGFAIGAAIDITLRIGLPQLELGAFATSVIPTTTTALTRAADVASVNTLSPWFNAAASTIYIEAATSPGLASFPTQLAITDGSTANQISLYTFTNGYYSNIRSGGVAQGDPSVLATSTVGAQYKFATGIEANNAIACLNGTLGIADTSITMPVGVNQMRIGAGATGGAYSNTWIRRITYYPRRLSNAELVSITS